MTPENKKIVYKFIEENIGSFHSARIEKIKSLRLKTLLKRKNPYLYKAKNIETAQDLIKNILDAYLISQEETIFGTFFESLAIFICHSFYGGAKSAAEGIDLEFDKDNIKYIVSIKSGPNWGNNGQIAKMKDNFRKAKRILNSNFSMQNIVAINGCCYGKISNPDKGEYLKLCGERFWTFISDDEFLYTDLIEPIGYKAKEKNVLFHKAYSQVVNIFTQEFLNEFSSNGSIDWKKLIQFNSSA